MKTYKVWGIYGEVIGEFYSMEEAIEFINEHKWPVKEVIDTENAYVKKIRTTCGFNDGKEDKFVIDYKVTIKG